tara:strand:- start:533 stop:898 length:366 start_codon:yes stop_codon:yes gene_type:complete
LAYFTPSGKRIPPPGNISIVQLLAFPLLAAAAVSIGEWKTYRTSPAELLLSNDMFLAEPVPATEFGVNITPYKRVLDVVTVTVPVPEEASTELDILVLLNALPITQPLRAVRGHPEVPPQV